jgi:regulator of replication initiation timing
VSEVPSIVELLRRLATVESALTERDGRIEALTAENRRLSAENAELRRRLGQNSRNSKQPPSSDAGDTSMQIELNRSMTSWHRSKRTLSPSCLRIQRVVSGSS